MRWRRCSTRCSPEEIANDRFLVVRHALDLTRPPYTYTFSLHLQNTHAMGVRILVYFFPLVEEAKAPLSEL